MVKRRWCYHYRRPCADALERKYKGIIRKGEEIKIKGEMIMRKLLIILAVTTLLASSAYAQERDASEENAATKRSYSPYAGSEQPRNVYWGDTHLHTT